MKSPEKTVRLFLAEGVAAGLATAEIINWTGHVLTGSRSGLQDFLKRDEVKRTGVYFLTGTGLDDSGSPKVYIGEGDEIGQRLRQHDKDDKKSFWEHTCVVTSKDQNITKAHARYLEARLIAIAKASGKADVVNGTSPPTPGLPEADASDMDSFIEQLQLVLSVLGFDFLQTHQSVCQAISGTVISPTGHSDNPAFCLTSKKKGIEIEATAREVGGEFVVLQGSAAATQWTGRPDHGYARHHAQLVKSGKLTAVDGASRRFSADVGFASPSAASSVVLGRPDNGRTSWKVEGTNNSYGAWHSQQVDKAAADYGTEATA